MLYELCYGYVINISYYLLSGMTERNNVTTEKIQKKRRLVHPTQASETTVPGFNPVYHHKALPQAASSLTGTYVCFSKWDITTLYDG